MGSKIRPGRFDCYAKAEVDEERFTLLARDPQAPWLLRLWAIWRYLLGEDRAVTAEAWRCAAAMDRWRRRKRPTRTPFARIGRGRSDG